MEQIKPLGNRVSVKPLEAKEVSDGGIFIPSDAKEKPLYGTIRAIGSLVNDPALKPQEVVLFGKYCGTEINVGKEILLLLEEKEILGVVVDAELIKKFMEQGV